LLATGFRSGIGCQECIGTGLHLGQTELAVLVTHRANPGLVETYVNICSRISKRGDDDSGDGPCYGVRFLCQGRDNKPKEQHKLKYYFHFLFKLNLNKRKYKDGWLFHAKKIKWRGKYDPHGG